MGSFGRKQTMKRVGLVILALIISLPLVVSGQLPVYLDPSQPIDKRIDDLIPRLTLAEKGSLLSTTAPAIDRLKIPAMNGWNQSLHGIVWTKPTTMFPVPISMAATWNPQLVHDVAAAIADEGRAINNLWPTVPGKTEPGQQGQLVTVTANGERLRHNGSSIGRLWSTSIVIRIGAVFGRLSARTLSSRHASP